MEKFLYSIPEPIPCLTYFVIGFLIVLFIFPKLKVEVKGKKWLSAMIFSTIQTVISFVLAFVAMSATVFLIFIITHNSSYTEEALKIPLGLTIVGFHILVGNTATLIICSLMRRMKFETTTAMSLASMSLMLIQFSITALVALKIHKLIP